MAVGRGGVEGPVGIEGKKEESEDVDQLLIFPLVGTAVIKGGTTHHKPSK